jgi:hypothetical protein
MARVEEPFYPRVEEPFTQSAFKIETSSREGKTTTNVKPGASHHRQGKPKPPQSAREAEIKEDPTVPIFPDRVPTKPAKVDRDFADQWREANLRANRMRAGGWSKTNWCLAFARLRKRLGDAEVRQLVEWYRENAGRQFGKEPLFVKNPSSLTDKQVACFLDAAKGSGNKHVEVSEEAQRVADRLKAYYQWPKGSAQHLPVAVQKGLDNYRQWRSALERSFTDLKVDGFARWLREGGAPPAVAFIDRWMKDLFKRIATYKDWSAGLAAMTFYTGAGQFRNVGCEWARRRGGDKVWDDLTEAIG